MPRIVVPIAAPYRPPPRRKVPREPVMPGWAVALMLGALLTVAILIVLAGWLCLAVAAREPAPIVQLGRPVVAEKIDKIEPAVIPVATRTETPIVKREPTPVLVRHSVPVEPFPVIEVPLHRPPPPPEKPVVIKPIEKPKVEPLVDYSVRRLALPEAPKPPRLAISPIAHDDVAKALTALNVGYRFTQLAKVNLTALPMLKRFDVVFLTCADLYEQDFAAALPLRRFVEGGGTLYASDLQCDLILRAFPEFSGQALLPGVPQQIDARVVDSGLAAHLGRKTIPLTFDAAHWRPAAFDPHKVTVCLQGEYRDDAGRSLVAPLLVKFRVGAGTVIFTSFHHSKNDSVIVRKLIDYLVFASVNARSEKRVEDLMTRHGFAATDMRPHVVARHTPVSVDFAHAGGGLQIGLGFEPAGARMKLTVRSPRGQTIEHDDDCVFLIEIPRAEAGAWQYTVTPLDQPQPRFPLVSAIGLLKRLDP